MILHLGYRCNNRCVFCAQGDLRLSETSPPGDGDVAATLAAGRAAGHDAVVFVGGEPTVHPGLPGWIAEARRAGYRSVRLQTNGRRLAYPGYAAALAEAGLEAVEVSLHGPTDAIHAYHTRVPGSFAHTVRGLRAARAAGLPVALTLVLTRSNFRHLAEAVRLAASARAVALHLAWPRGRGQAAAGFDRVVPRLALLRPYLAAAARLASSLRLPLVLGGLPACATAAAPGAVRLDDPGAGGVFGPACATCPLRGACPGVDPAYAAVHGTAELLPVAAAAEVASADLADRFAGTGPMAEAPPELPPAAPAAEGGGSRGPGPVE